MAGVGSGKLIGSEIHGFHTLQDLDIQTMLDEAYTRWLRPNEIHALLCNHKFFTINVKPVNLPKSGTIVLFDRKMLRNFRKDGHNWKKKKDGKTIKEAHEHLKVGNEERIHVYYAHGNDNPTFVRRCYWLLDKSQEHIVLVHYRETHEAQAAPATPGNSYSSSISELSPKLVAEDINSGVRNTCNTDLDIQTMLDEAYTRWLRPNEIHALLCNHKFFTINVKPVNLPKSGTIVLFDRKMLRNFRKDGHNWKKKKDGKTIKEAHEHLKVGNEERIHVYYAHGNDNPTFVRRCYWLLDKSQEHIVLVHYRETHEAQAAPATPGNSYSSSISELSPKLVAEDINSGVRNTCNTGFEVRSNSLGSRNHEIRLHEINTLDWDELLVPADISNQSHPTEEDMLYFTEQLQTAPRGSTKQGYHLAGYNGSVDIPSYPGLDDPVYQNNNSCGAGEFSNQHVHCGVESNLQSRDSRISSCRLQRISRYTIIPRSRRSCLPK
ncbi:PREDICTED: calmodulin-binding transcription activator 5-like [Camelina sativa]|uniref:Calmodulin-binding transcription activator 5-like n=1 Tax=Camelina sativa TaxID=90675 RepID=A0ABM1QKX3_CAMSA|nr:PREDICTED: calmodulin-binding transcription activator 5-like [Camelina sativa]